MAPPQKGKQGTKGAKQIVEENKTTLSFYRNMTFGSIGLTFLTSFIFFEITKTFIIMSILSVVILLAAYQFMIYMAKSHYSETGQLIDPGNDLNIEGGIGENVKDLIILTSGTMLLSLFTNYFWLLLLLLPMRAFWLLWGSIIKPWLSQKNANDEQEIDPKKQKKMERKMRRVR